MKSSGAPQEVDRYVSEAADGGVRFLEKKRWHFPWTSAHREIDRAEVAGRLQSGDDRLSVQGPEAEIPTALRTLEDLREVAACQGPTPAPGLPSALRELAEGDWRFQNRERDEVGIYGAYEGLTEGRYEVRACRRAVAVVLDPQKAERMARFYAAGGESARLEADGFDYFGPDNEPVAAFEAGPGAMVGQGDEPWLGASSQADEVREFARLRALAASADEVRTVLGMSDGEAEKFTAITRLRKDAEIVELALAATHPTEAELRAELPALVETHGADAAGKVLAHLEDPLAERIADWKPAARAIVYSELARAAHSPMELGELYKRAARKLQYAGQPAPTLALACLEQALPVAGKGDVDSIVTLATACQSLPGKERALDFLVTQPECAGIRQLRAELAPSLADEKSRGILCDVLLANARVGTSDSEGQKFHQSLQNRFYSYDVNAKQRAAVAGQRLETLLGRPKLDPFAVAQQAATVQELGDTAAARMALERLAGLGECAGLAQARAEALGSLTSDLSRGVLDKLLLAEPSLGTDVASQQQFFLRLDSYLSNYGAKESERKALATAHLTKLMTGTPPAAVLAAQARSVAGFGDVAAARQALERLATLPECAGLKRALAEIEPHCRGEVARSTFYERLLAQPTLEAGDRAQQTFTQQLLSHWNNYGVSDKDRIPLAGACLQRLMATPLNADNAVAVANQARYVLSLGEVATARGALAHVTALPECAGVKKALAELEPSCRSEQSRKILYERLLAQPLLGADEVAQQGLTRNVLSSMYSYSVDAGEQKDLAAARMGQLLAGSAPPEVIAQQAQLCQNLGDEASGQRAIDHLKSLPVCAGMAQAEREMAPYCASEMARKQLRNRLLANPLVGTDVAAQEHLATRLLSEMQRYGVDQGEQKALSVSRLERLMAMPLEASLIEPVARRAQHVASYDPARAEAGLRHLFGVCPGAASVYADVLPDCTDETSRKTLLDRLLADPEVADRSRFMTGLATHLSISGAPAQVRRAVLAAELDRALAALPENPARVGQVAPLALAAGDKTALERAVKGLHGVGPVGAIMDDYLPLATTDEMRNALALVLMKTPPQEDSPQARQTVQTDWLRALTRVGVGVEALKRDLARLESERSARREVEALARPDRSTLIDEQGGAVVVGGVVVPKRGQVLT